MSGEPTLTEEAQTLFDRAHEVDENRGGRALRDRKMQVFLYAMRALTLEIAALRETLERTTTSK